MFALPFSDPLWQKLDDAYRTDDIPKTLQNLTETWDPEVAEGLLWGALCHQDTCYGATYAAYPHLLAMTKTLPASEATESIAFFLGYVALVAFETEADTAPQGLPSTLEGWDEKLEPFRSLARYSERDLADPSFRDKEREQSRLARYRRILAHPPISDFDLNTIERIRLAFFEALPQVADLLEQHYQDTEPSHRHHFLSGIAATLGATPLARLLDLGDEGGFACNACGWFYEYAVYDEKMAIYASPVAPGAAHDAVGDDPALLDYREGAPNRADGFVVPSNQFLGLAAERILRLVTEAEDTENKRRLSHFLGSFACTKCGETTQLPETA